MIYLDNAATTLHKPECVIAAVTAAHGSMGNASRGAHEGSLAASRVVFEAREKVAAAVGFVAPAALARDELERLQEAEA